VTLALPMFEAWSGRGPRARAEGVFPRRFGLFYWGNGIVPSHWVPASVGEGWTPSPLLAPLSAVRDDITVVSGLEVMVPNVVPHYSGAAGLLTGAPAVVRDGVRAFGAASVDQRIAAEIGGATRYRSIEAGVLAKLGVSFSSAAQRNPPQTAPAALFERLFGSGFRLPGEVPTFDPSLASRRSVLDAVLAEAAELSPALSAHDRTRLEAHLASVREIELRIASAEREPPELAACSRPPMVDVPAVDAEGRAVIRERSRAIADLLVMALACDQTRVVSFTFSDPIADDLYPDTDGGHHQLTHDEGGDQPQVRSIIEYVMGELAYFVGKLGEVREGDGRLLDNVALLATSDVSLGRTHSHADFPLLFAGSAGGRLRTGLHHRSASQESASHLVLSLMRAVGVQAASYGEVEAQVSTGLTEIEV
jgi:hypothetical protein